MLPDDSTGQGPGTFSHKTIKVQGEYGAVFAVRVQSFIEYYECRGTKLISETKLSGCNKCYKMDTGAVSRYILSRSQKSVTVQDFNGVQMRALTAVASAKAGVQVQQPVQICLGCRS